jgi:hypothetical protein
MKMLIPQKPKQDMMRIQKLTDALVADSKMHTENEALLQTRITDEVKFRGVAVSAEAEAREDADAFL